MKKLLTLVLALVMAFAIAAPALALGADPIAVADNDKNIDLTVAIYSGHLSTNSDLEKYTPWTQNVLKDQEISIVVKASAKKAQAVAEGTSLSYEIFGLKETAQFANSTAGAFADGQYAKSDKKNYDELADSGKLRAIAKDDSVVYVIKGVVNGALSGNITLGFSGKLEGAATKKTGVLVSITDPGANAPYGYTATIRDTAVPKDLKISVGNNGAVNTITWDNANLSKTLVTGTSVSTMKWSTAPGEALPAADQAALDGIFAQFGLKWENLSGYALPASYIYAQVAGATRSLPIASSLYTASLTVSDPTTVPATGDMSVVGIALAIVALAAAGFVVAKKVRA